VERRAESKDIARIAHLINELPGYDMFSISTLADDAPADQFTISRLYPSIKYCLKPIRVTTTDHKDTLSIMEMAYMVAGGEGSLQGASIPDASLLPGCFAVDDG
jgi:trimethylamine--corrinoid protein Co-methyltransferase